MFYISQNQLDELSNVVYDLATVQRTPHEAAGMAINAQNILMEIEYSQPCRAANLLDSIIHLRSAANYAQFGAAMCPFSVTKSYILEKFNRFQDDPIHYFATLDAASRQRFANWILTSQPEGAIP